MKRIVICLSFVLLFAGLVYSQTKTLTGTVIDYSVGTKGNWETITVKVGSRAYQVYLLTMDYPAAKTVGTVKKPGRKVKVFYTRNITTSGDYAGAVIAAKVVEIKLSRNGKK